MGRGAPLSQRIARENENEEAVGGLRGRVLLRPIST